MRAMLLTLISIVAVQALGRSQDAKPAVQIPGQHQALVVPYNNLTSDANVLINSAKRLRSTAMQRMQKLSDQYNGQLAAMQRDNDNVSNANSKISTSLLKLQDKNENKTKRVEDIRKATRQRESHLTDLYGKLVLATRFIESSLKGVKAAVPGDEESVELGPAQGHKATFAMESVDREGKAVKDSSGVAVVEAQRAWDNKSHHMEIREGEANKVEKHDEEVNQDEQEEDGEVESKTKSDVGTEGLAQKDSTVRLLGDVIMHSHRPDEEVEARSQSDVGTEDLAEDATTVRSLGDILMRLGRRDGEVEARSQKDLETEGPAENETTVSSLGDVLTRLGRDIKSIAAQEEESEAAMTKSFQDQVNEIRKQHSALLEDNNRLIADMRAEEDRSKSLDYDLANASAAYHKAALRLTGLKIFLQRVIDKIPDA